ncbi:hypothetical protein A8W25_12815 [Streptomyces sp. ERV7]|nr:hypothetical protein A8W25_12815 [Streptomyces sp. ERV7]
MVAGEPGHRRAAAGLDDGERGPGPLDLAGARREQFAGGRVAHAEHGGDLARAQPVADGELQGLALLGSGARGLGPGEQGQFAPAPFGLLGRDRGPAALLAGGRAAGVGALAGAFALGELAQTRPARQRVQPGLALVLGVGAARVLPLGDGEDVTEDVDGLVVVAEHGQAVGEQAVEIRLVARRRALGQRPGRAALRPVCAGGVRGVIQTAALHPAKVGAGSRVLRAA